MRNPPKNPLSRDTIFGRVVVVLDVTCDHLPALDSAVSVAARLGADLTALFIQDDRLVALEDHPQVRGISLPTGLGGAIEPGSMQRGCRALACRARRHLARLSKHYGVGAEFEFLTGDISERLKSSGGKRQLYVVESCGRALARHVRMASTGPSMARSIPGPVLFVGSRPRQIQSVIHVYDDSENAQRGLDTALELGIDSPVMLTTLLVDGVDAEAFEAEVRQKIRNRGARIHLHIQRMRGRDTNTIIGVARSMHANMVILPESTNYPTDDDVVGFTTGLDCPVLIVRGDDDGDSGGETTSRRAVLEN